MLLCLLPHLVFSFIQFVMFQSNHHSNKSLCYEATLSSRYCSQVGAQIYLQCEKDCMHSLNNFFLFQRMHFSKHPSVSYLKLPELLVRIVIQPVRHVNLEGMEKKLLEGSSVEQCSLQSVLSNMWKLFTFNKGWYSWKFIINTGQSLVLLFIVC